jgi:hypothetical protein
MPTGPFSPNLKFDHYAIEWVEIKADGSVHAVLSKRVETCRFLLTTFATEIITIGSPIGVTIQSSCVDMAGVQCGFCNPKEKHCNYRLTPRRDKLATLQSYGGLQWELIKYINSISIGANGFTGDVGRNTGFYKGNKFRILTISTANILNNSSLESGNYDSVLDTFAQQAQHIQNMRDSGELDLTATIENRRANLPTPHNGGSNLPCCNANDIDFINECNCQPVYYSSCEEACGPNCGDVNPLKTDADCNIISVYGLNTNCSISACPGPKYMFWITGFELPIQCECSL